MDKEFSGILDAYRNMYKDKSTETPGQLNEIFKKKDKKPAPKPKTRTEPKLEDKIDRISSAVTGIKNAVVKNRQNLRKFPEIREDLAEDISISIESLQRIRKKLKGLSVNEETEIKPWEKDNARKARTEIGKKIQSLNTAISAVDKAYTAAKLRGIEANTEKDYAADLWGYVKVLDNLRKSLNKTGKFKALKEDTFYEAKGGLSGPALVGNLSTICLAAWYDITKKFTSKPDQYDINNVEQNDNYLLFRMTPGNDVKDKAYDAIESAVKSMVKALNNAFDKEVFQQQMKRHDGNLEALVSFIGQKGGVFQCRAVGSESGTQIDLTMPTENELKRAFSAMAQVPHPDNAPRDGIEGDIGGMEQPVAGEPNPEVPMDQRPQGGGEDMGGEFDGEDMGGEAPPMDGANDDMGGPQGREQRGTSPLDDEEDDEDMRMKALRQGFWDEVDAHLPKTIYRERRERSREPLFKSKRRMKEDYSKNNVSADDKRQLHSDLESCWDKIESFLSRDNKIKLRTIDTDKTRGFEVILSDPRSDQRILQELDSIFKEADGYIDSMYGFNRGYYKSNLRRVDTNGDHDEARQLRAFVGIRDDDGSIENTLLKVDGTTREGFVVKMLDSQELKDYIENASSSGYETAYAPSTPEVTSTVYQLGGTMGEGVFTKFMYSAELKAAIKRFKRKIGTYEAYGSFTGNNKVTLKNNINRNTALMFYSECWSPLYNSYTMGSSQWLIVFTAYKMLNEALMKGQDFKPALEECGKALAALEFKASGKPEPDDDDGDEELEEDVAANSVAGGGVDGAEEGMGKKARKGRIRGRLYKRGKRKTKTYKEEAEGQYYVVDYVVKKSGFRGSEPGSSEEHGPFKSRQDAANKILELKKSNMTDSRNTHTYTIKTMNDK